MTQINNLRGKNLFLKKELLKPEEKKDDKPEAKPAAPQTTPKGYIQGTKKLEEFLADYEFGASAADAAQDTTTVDEEPSGEDEFYALKDELMAAMQNPDYDVSEIREMFVKLTLMYNSHDTSLLDGSNADDTSAIKEAYNEVKTAYNNWSAKIIAKLEYNHVKIALESSLERLNTDRTTIEELFSDYSSSYERLAALLEGEEKDALAAEFNQIKAKYEAWIENNEANSPESADSVGGTNNTISEDEMRKNSARMDYQSAKQQLEKSLSDPNCNKYKLLSNFTSYQLHFVRYSAMLDNEVELNALTAEFNQIKAEYDARMGNLSTGI